MTQVFNLVQGTLSINNPSLYSFPSSSVKWLQCKPFLYSEKCGSFQNCRRNHFSFQGNSSKVDDDFFLLNTLSILHCQPCHISELTPQQVVWRSQIMQRDFQAHTRCDLISSFSLLCIICYYIANLSLTCQTNISKPKLHMVQLLGLFPFFIVDLNMFEKEHHYWSIQIMDTCSVT